MPNANAPIENRNASWHTPTILYGTSGAISDRAARRRDDAARHRDRRGLAGAVGPEQAEALAAHGVEIDRTDGGARAVVLAPSRLEHHLAERLAALEGAVAVGGARQRQRAIHDRLEPARRDVAQHGEQVRLAAHRRAEDLDLAEEDVAQIDRGLETGRRAARDDAPAVAHRLDARGEHLAADVLDHGVDAALAGLGAAHGGEVGGGVVDADIGTKRLRALELGGAARRGDHARAVELRDLDRGDADAGAGAVDEHGVARRDARLAHDHLPRGEEREEAGGGVREVEPLGVRREVGRGDDDVLGVAALRVLAEDPVVAAEVVAAAEAGRAAPAGEPGLYDGRSADGGGGDHAGAEGVDRAGDVGAEPVWIFEAEGRAAPAHPDVEVVERHRADPHAHLAGTGLGDRELL